MSRSQLKSGNAKVARGKELEFLAASHEDPLSPGAFKKVLFDAKLLPSGKVQMLNWAKVPAGRAFQNHFHEDMHEVFVITSGKAEMKIGIDSYILESGDAVIVPPLAEHSMLALDGKDVHYLVFGVSAESGGKTIILPT